MAWTRGPKQPDLDRRLQRGIKHLAGLFAVLVVLAGGCKDDAGKGAGTASRTRSIPDFKLEETDTFVSAAVCGACHQAIHASWQQSMHARSMSNGVFQAAYRAAKQTNAKRAQLCLRCHAPTVRHTKDFAALDPITLEGVTCDFCHSIRSVQQDSPDGQVDLDIGPTKYGPLSNAQSPAHQVVDSKLHRSSELCAVCHEFRNEHGVAILETYSEWKASPFAKEGTQCQDCHMPLVPGRVTALELEGTADRGVNLHDISGSHDLEQIRKAVTMEIRRVERLGEKNIDVIIGVHNVGSGHCFPTGLPAHRAVLEVELTDRGRMVGRQIVEFAKILLDERGLPIQREEDMFLEARSIRTDTRLKSGENRTIRVAFRDVDALEGQVTASLFYEYSTRTVSLIDGVETIEPREMKFLLVSKKRAIPRRGR